MKRIGLLVLALLTVCGLTLSGVPALPAAAQPAPPSAQAVEELALAAGEAAPDPREPGVLVFFE